MGIRDDKFWAAFLDVDPTDCETVGVTRTHARFGGRGAAVTAAVVAKALANGKLLLHQTLESNQPAIRIAFSLGYDRYANHLAVRLSREAPDC